MRTALDKIRGCLLGGAAGDALGYPVEFLSARGMKVRYGEEGITEYSLRQGIAVISDDTQMSLFTANGLLCAETRAALGGRAQNVPDTVLRPTWTGTAARPVRTPCRTYTGQSRMSAGCWTCRSSSAAARRAIPVCQPWRTWSRAARAAR